MNIIPSDSAIGATVRDVSMANSPSPALVDELEMALEQYGVLVFPDQILELDEQIRFSRALGELETANTVSAPISEFPEIAEVGNTGSRPVSFAPASSDGELEWHTDHIQHPVPSKSTLLYARETPSLGGDTLFACTFSAYDALDAQTRKLCDSAIAIHSASGLRDYLARQEEFDVTANSLRDEGQSVQWPLVRRHPLSGRPALYFAAQLTIGIEGWQQDEALAFIRDLTAHATQPQFVYRHRWEAGQAVLWDNRRVLHAATWYDKSRYRRYLLRTMMKEDRGVHGLA